MINPSSELFYHNNTRVKTYSSILRDIKFLYLNNKMCALMPDKPQKFKFPNSVKYSINILTQNLNLNLRSIH